MMIIIIIYLHSIHCRVVEAEGVPQQGVHVGLDRVYEHALDAEGVVRAPHPGAEVLPVARCSAV